MTTAEDDLRGVPAHPEGPALVAYLDGELPPDEREVIRAHLETCWACRTRLAAREERIETFMHARHVLTPPGFPPSEPPLDTFRARLAHHRAETSAGVPSLPEALTRLVTGLGRLVPARRLARPAWVALSLVVALGGVSAWARGDLRALMRETFGRWFSSPAAHPPQTPPVPEPRAPRPGPQKGRAPRFRPLPLSYANSLATLGEVAAALALHRVGACLGEEVNVFQMSDGSLLVQGLVDTMPRSEDIERALAQLPQRARVEIHSSDDLQTGAELFDPPGRPASAPPPAREPSLRLLDLSGLEMPMYERLHRHLSVQVAAGGGIVDEKQIRERVADFASDVVRLSRQILFQAWALRNIEVEFSERRTKSLPQASLAEIAGLRAEHRRAVSETARKLLDRLDEGGLTAGVAPDEAELRRDVPGPTEAEDGDRLLRLATDQELLVRGLFTASATSADPRSGLAGLWTLLRQLS